MTRRLVCAVAATAVLTGGVVAGAATKPTGSAFTSEAVTATVTATTASLADGVVTRTWALAADGSVTTTALGGPGSGGAHQWAVPAPDFRIDVDGVPTTSTSGWVLESVTAAAPPALPGQPASARGAALLFRYALASPLVSAVGVELDRAVVLHPGATVLETRSRLADNGPAPVRVASYTLDQVQLADPAMPAEVQAYNGGSDWRDDYRHVSTPAAPFDAEGEVLRLGDQAGVFLVSQRRGGAMSRVAVDGTHVASVGVDWARDLFDYGPLQDSPPSYNRLENPAYPLPVRARMLAPLDSLDLGTSFVGVYAGGAQEAGASFARDFSTFVEPSFDGIGLNTFHPWNHGPGMSDANLRPQVDAAASLGIESFMLDDQWQGGPGGESGDWRWDPQRFPGAETDDVPDFVDYLHARGMSLGLWMSPLEFNTVSTTYAAHPDWACAPTGDVTAQVPDDAGLGVWDATNPQLQNYLLGVVDRLVRDDDVREFKFDFMAWVDCPPHDYADYEDAFVSLVRQMEQAHPGVTFELDETNDQRSWPFESAALGASWCDNMHLHGSTEVAKLLHDVWSAAPWVPTRSLGVGTFDATLTGDYSGVEGVRALLPLALLTHVTFWTDLTQLTAEQQDETRWWLSWYAAHRAELGPAVYELTAADPIDGASWAAWQPWHGDGGYVFAFRQDDGPPTQSLALHDVDPQASYAVTDVRTGDSLGSFTGARLASGLPVTLAPHSSVVLAVTRM